MNWYQIFYLFSLADKISATMLILAIIASCAYGIIIISRIIYLSEGGDKSPVVSKMMWVMPIVVFLSWSVWAFVPNRQDMTLIVAGGSVGQFIMSDDNAKQLPADITRFLRAEILDATAGLSEGIKKDLGIKSKRDSLMEMGKEELVKMLTDE